MAQPIDRDTLYQWMRESRDFALVDALPHEAYEKHHLPGAISIVSDDIEEVAPRRLPDPERPIVVYCGSTQCQRSVKAAERLERMGYTHVHEYVEGRQDWEAAGLELESGPDPEAAS